MACCNNGCHKNHFCIDDTLLLILLAVWFLFFQGGCSCHGTATNVDTYRTNGCGCGCNED